MSGLDGSPCVPEQSLGTANRSEKASHRAWAKRSGRRSTPGKGATMKGNSLGNQLRREDILPPFSMFYSLGHRYAWNTIPWRKLEVRVFKLQRRIYQATTRGETQKARRLQKLLAASWSAKSLAVRRVTQENTGKKTAGVDGVKSLTPPQRLKLISAMDLHAPAKPVRRIWIPKPGKLEERPLGLPMACAYCIS